MKNVLVATFQPGQDLYTFARLEAYVRAQIENSLELGWAPDDILLLANFGYEFMGVRARQFFFEDPRLTTCKISAMQKVLADGPAHEEFWMHDLDAWQNSWFDFPPFRDVGICLYSSWDTPRFNSGSMFYRPAAQDILTAVSALLRANTTRDEEPTLDEVLNAPLYEHRVTVVNSTYNVGCTNFAARYLRSDQPIRVCHFHPDHHSNVKTQLLAHNILHVRVVDERLERLIGRYFRMIPEPENATGYGARRSPLALQASAVPPEGRENHG